MVQYITMQCIIVLLNETILSPFRKEQVLISRYYCVPYIGLGGETRGAQIVAICYYMT